MELAVFGAALTAAVALGFAIQLLSFWAATRALHFREPTFKRALRVMLLVQVIGW